MRVAITRPVTLTAQPGSVVEVTPMQYAAIKAYCVPAAETIETAAKKPARRRAKKTAEE